MNALIKAILFFVIIMQYLYVLLRAAYISIVVVNLLPLAV